MAEPGEQTLPATELRGPGAGRWIRYFFSAIWLLYLIQPVSGLFAHHHTPPWIAGGLAVAVAFCVVYIWLINTFDEGGPWQGRAGLPALFALAALACVVYGADWIALWIYVSAAAGYVVEGRAAAVRVVLGVTGCFALFSWISHAGMHNFIGLLLPVVLLGIAMSGFRVQVRLMRELSRARETVAKLAASDERLRLARDMHDLTGQSLSMITLKSELAGKLLSRLPPSEERDAALAEAADIGQVSRQTLHDFREAVSGYRLPTLAVEMVTARAVLETAGIGLDEDAALTQRSGAFDPEAEAALAWCLREAVTNVIRHSGARHCRLRLTERPCELSLEVSDDGRGLPGLQARSASEPRTTSPAPHPGSGLRGMSERLTSLGGSLSFGHARAGRSGGTGLRLVATVPARPMPAPPGADAPVRATSAPAASVPAVPPVSR